MAFSVTTGGFPTAGLNHINDVVVHGTAAIGTWYIALIDDGPTFALTDAVLSHAGWTEADDYDEATRPAWTEGAAAAGVTTNAVSVDFTINVTITIAGCFLISNATKLAETGYVILLEGTFSGGDRAAQDNDILKVTVTITTANA